MTVVTPNVITVKVNAGTPRITGDLPAYVMGELNQVAEQRHLSTQETIEAVCIIGIEVLNLAPNETLILRRFGEDGENIDTEFDIRRILRT